MKGMRTPGPQRPFTGWPEMPLGVVPVPQIPAPLTWSAAASKDARVGVA